MRLHGRWLCALALLSAEAAADVGEPELILNSSSNLRGTVVDQTGGVYTIYNNTSVIRQSAPGQVLNILVSTGAMIGGATLSSFGPAPLYPPLNAGEEAMFLGSFTPAQQKLVAINRFGTPLAEISTLDTIFAAYSNASFGVANLSVYDEFPGSASPVIHYGGYIAQFIPPPAPQYFGGVVGSAADAALFDLGYEPPPQYVFAQPGAIARFVSGPDRTAHLVPVDPNAPPTGIPMGTFYTRGDLVLDSPLTEPPTFTQDAVSQAIFEPIRLGRASGIEDYTIDTIFEVQPFGQRAILSAGVFLDESAAPQTGVVISSGSADSTIPPPPLPKGDVNDDGVVDNFDIDAFVLCLTDPAAAALAGHNCAAGDMNMDGATTAQDIDGFVAALVGSGTPRPAGVEPHGGVTLDPDFANPGFGILFGASGDPLPGCPTDTVATITAIRGSVAGVAAMRYQIPGGVSVVVVLDSNGFHCVLRQGDDFGQGAITSINEVSNVNDNGQFAVTCTVTGGGRAIYRFQANVPPNSADGDWQLY